MNTIQNQKIGLYIGGTKSRQSGFNPLMITDFFAGDEDNNMDKSTVVIGKPVYVIKHTNDYILYLLIDKKVNPCDRDTLGTLSIALTITRDMQLADGKSPYTLLKAAYDKFRAEYMEPSNDGCDRFLNKDVNRADFIAIMNQYPLERRVSAYIPMNPSGLTGTLCVPQEKMADLFRIPQVSFNDFINENYSIRKIYEEANWDEMYKTYPKLLSNYISFLNMHRLTFKGRIFNKEAKTQAPS